MSSRFLIGRLPDGSKAWASIDESSLCTVPLVAPRRFPAFLAPFTSEAAAHDALIAAGADAIESIGPKTIPLPRLAGGRGQVLSNPGKERLLS